MYQKIYVPVDNSEYSNRAIAAAVRLGQAFDSKLVGCHVYAAKMHDYRFKQMEYTLPEEYLEETELERQRKIHDSLITMGLKLISDSYLDQMDKLCKERGLPFEPKMMDGKHHVEIVNDIQSSDYDLVVLGVLGIGRVRDSQIGSVCERVTRQCKRDTWVIKRLPAEGEAERDTILVGIDGSPQSFGALMTALDLAASLGKKVEIIGVYDPYLHYSVFNGIVGVLTEKAAKVFRFEEQNQLHEEIIDTGLAQIYQSHLDVAERMAQQRGVEVKKTLLDGKAFQKVLDHVRKTDPFLLVIGRIGVHSAADEPGLGSNTENLLRTCPCDVLLTTRLEHPEIDLKAEASIRWTPDAEQRMTRVPPMVRGIARTGILRLALEKGHSVITNAVIDEAMDRFMPKYTADATTRLAEQLVLERSKSKPVSMCRKCGVTAAESEAVRCAVCGGTTFDVVTPEMIEQIVAREGGAVDEATYDGRKLRWTEDARRALWTLKDAYQRRRAKARVEKSARGRRLGTVTLEFARAVIEEETGTTLVVPPPPARRATSGNGHTAVESDDVAEVDPDGPADEGPRLIARDDKNIPLVSSREWTAEAVERILRVPSGFMRNRTQERIEALAAQRDVTAVDLALVEEGIAIGRKMMEEMISGYQKSPEASRAAYKAADVTRPDLPTNLNEVGLMSEMARRRGAADKGEGLEN